jgi:hypothetical protein
MIYDMYFASLDSYISLWIWQIEKIPAGFTFELCQDR